MTTNPKRIIRKPTESPRLFTQEEVDKAVARAICDEDKYYSVNSRVEARKLATTANIRYPNSVIITYEYMVWVDRDLRSLEHVIDFEVRVGGRPGGRETHSRTLRIPYDRMISARDKDATIAHLVSRITDELSEHIDAPSARAYLVDRLVTII